MNVYISIHLSNKSANLGEHPPHGEVGLPLAAFIFSQFLEQLQKLLRMLSSLSHIVEEAAEQVQYLSLPGLAVS